MVQLTAKLGKDLCLRITYLAFIRVKNNLKLRLMKLNKFYSINLIVMLLLITGLFSSCCDEAIYVGGSLDRACQSDPAKCPDEFWICPGESVDICWKSEDKVTISEGLGNQGKEGCITVTPEKTTKYKFSNGDSDCNAYITVNVVTDGTKATLDAGLKSANDNEQYYFELKFDSNQVSDNIMVTSIEPVCTAFCFVHEPPIIDYPYAECNDKLCNVLWTLKKVEPNGNFSIIDINGIQVSLNNIRMKGNWEFRPKEG